MRIVTAIKFACIVAAFVPALVLGQVKGPTEDSAWYYEIGGAEPVSAPANLESLEMVVGGSVELGLGYSCGKFDPTIAVSQSLNNLSQGADDLVDAMVGAATAAIAALPATILQRANPGLYDLFQNALLRAEERVSIATKSCEQMETELARGKNPYADLVTVSKGNDWKVQMGIGGNDAVSAKGAVEASNGSNGVPWIRGIAGGVDQEPIRMTSDVVRAGYNLLLNRTIDSEGPAPATAASRLADLWPSPEAA
ncbi:MAG TPA: integrating conjugative element protein, partial [Woeseiaceae bacterium]|nr:integrating conjugative element protein [Woeseiaceae bacterium]